MGAGGKMPGLVVSIILITVIYGLDSTYRGGQRTCDESSWVYTAQQMGYKAP
jgi:hypothetical protein